MVLASKFNEFNNLIFGIPLANRKGDLEGSDDFVA